MLTPVASAGTSQKILVSKGKVFTVFVCFFCVAFVLFWWWCGLGFACLFVWGSLFVSLVFLLVTNISISVKFLWESPKFGNSKICPFLKILATVSMTGCSLPSVLWDWEFKNADLNQPSCPFLSGGFGYPPRLLYKCSALWFTLEKETFILSHWYRLSTILQSGIRKYCNFSWKGQEVLFIFGA